MPLPKPLSEIKKDLHASLANDDSLAVINSLEELLPEGSEKKRQVILLEGRLNQTDKDRRRGVATQEHLDVAYNQIRSALYDLIDALAEKDFDPAVAGTSAQPAVAAVPKFVVIYDLADSEHCKMLNKHLNVLKITKRISVYNVNEALAGEDVLARAKAEMENADYLLVLITVNLFNSPDWFELVYNAMGEGRRIIPIQVERADFEGTGLEKLKSLPSMNRAVSDFKNNLDGAYVDIVTELRKLLPKS